MILCARRSESSLLRPRSRACGARCRSSSRPRPAPAEAGGPPRAAGWRHCSSSVICFARSVSASERIASTSRSRTSRSSSRFSSCADLAVERLFLLLDAALLALRVGALLFQFPFDLLTQVQCISLGGECQFPLLRLRCVDNLLGVGLSLQSFVAPLGIFDARRNHPCRRRTDGEPDKQAHQCCDESHLKSSLRVHCVYRSAGAHPGHLYGEIFVGAVADRRSARRAGCS